MQEEDGIKKKKNYHRICMQQDVVFAASVDAKQEAAAFAASVDAHDSWNCVTVSLTRYESVFPVEHTRYIVSEDMRALTARISVALARPRTSKCMRDLVLSQTSSSWRHLAISGHLGILPMCARI